MGTVGHPRTLLRFIDDSLLCVGIGASLYTSPCILSLIFCGQNERRIDSTSQWKNPAGERRWCAVVARSSNAAPKGSIGGGKW
jgi:hypothetical protein